MDERLDKLLDFLREEYKQGIVPVGNRIHVFCKDNEIEYHSPLLSEYVDMLISKNIIKETKTGDIWPDVEFHKFKGFVKTTELENEDSELKLNNLKLQNDSFNYEKDIRGLKEQLLILNLIKEYWWFIGLCLGIGVVIGKWLLQ